MKFKFKNKKISGILNVLPEKISKFDDEASNFSFPLRQTIRMKKTMGYEQHRIVKETTSTYDLCKVGIQTLLDENMISKEEIGAIIVVTITPDYFVPHVSNLIQGEFGFNEDVFCMDILQGCCGFIMGLIESFMILEQFLNKKVLLVNSDTLSKKVSSQDRNSYPIVGDCASITIIENTKDENNIFIDMRADGIDGDALKIPAGGSRLACSPETAEMKIANDGNIRCLDNLVMNGTAVFTFVMEKVPNLVLCNLNDAQVSKDDIDYYLFHQPNEFMLHKLADKIGVPRERVFSNIVREFGNPSGASIPLVATYNIGGKLLKNDYKCCLSAFGGGLNFGSIVMKLGNLDFCRSIISKC
jgi:3-oxoacyl-[acyl-carrier-protein] synthase III